MSNAPLTDDEIAEIKLRMGYGAMKQTAIPYLDTSLLFETVVANNVSDYGIGYIRNTILPNLRDFDTALSGGDRSFDKVVEVVGEVKLDMRQSIGLTQQRRRHWLRELAKTVRIRLAEEAGDPIASGCDRVVLS